MKIDIWSDTACPWCYIGKARLDAALAQFQHRDQVEIEWHSYQLDPTLPEHYPGTEAEYLAQTKGMPEEQVRGMFRHVSAAAAGSNLTLNLDDVVVANTWKAHRLLQWAKQEAPERVPALEDALFEAHFVTGRHVGDPDTLAQVASSAGFDAEAARAAASSETWDAAVQTDVQAARQIGVQGVPFFVLAGKYGISGAQESATFGQALQQVWDELHPAVTLKGLDLPEGDACGPDGC